MAAVPTPPGFDFSNQAVNFMMDNHNGTMSPIGIPMVVIDGWSLENIRLTALFSAEMMACLVVLLTAALLTKADKRTTSVFILNEVSLFLGFLRNLLLFLFFESPFNKFYASFTQDVTSVPTRTYAQEVASTVMGFLFASCVVVSLVFQAWAVSKMMSRNWHLVLRTISIFILLLGVGVRLTLTIMDCRAILDDEIFDFSWIITFNRAMECAAIAWFTGIFTSKLIITLKRRRALGLAKWGYIHVLAIMGGCTMVIPLLFSIIWWATAAISSFPGSDSLTLTLVACMLPISSLWASSVYTGSSQQQSSNFIDLFASSPSSVCTKCGDTYNMATTANTTATDSTAVATGRNDSLTPLTMFSPAHVSAAAAQRDPLEDDMEAMGVRVDRTYSIRSEKLE